MKPRTLPNDPIPLGRIAPSVGRLIADTAAVHPDLPFFNTLHPDGTVESVTWSQALRDMASMADWFFRHGIRPGQRVSCVTPNSYAMFIWEMAALSVGIVSAPLYYRFEPAVLERLLSQVKPKAVLTESARKGIPFRKILGSDVPIVSETGLKGILRHGAGTDAFVRAVDRVGPGDACLIQYTSGTTGDFKGVVLTHGNLTSEQKAFSLIWDLPEGARFLSYLPWPHSFGGIFERITAAARGASIYLEPSAGRDLESLLRSWGRVRPTHFFSVPKVYVKLMNAAKGSARVRRLLFHRDLRLFFTAGVPLPAECTRYFESQGVPIMEGWGLTETSPTVTLTRPGDKRIHSIVGRPIPGVKVRISAEGEILVKGPNVMKGYFRRPGLTRKAFDRRGWFHTGDLGEAREEGLRIICRKDGVFKLLNGEKVPSLPIEEALTLSSQHILHAVAAGEGREYACVLVFPEPRLLEACARGDRGVLNRIRGEIRRHIRPFASSPMAIRAAAVVCGELSVEAGDLTPTLKLIRRRVLERHPQWIEAVYRPEKHPEFQRWISRF